MLMLLVSAFSFVAKADITVTLKVDDATRLTGYIQYTDASYNYVQTDLDLTQFTGEGGTFTLPASYGYVYINATDGNCIVSAMNETSGSSAYMSGNTQAQFYLYSDATLSVISADLESTRTASCTVNVDDASKVNMSYYTGQAIKLENGENTIKFNPNGETPFQIAHTNYGETLYQVSVNGVAQTDSYGRYYVTVADGDVLDIKADFPNEPATLTFSYGENETEVLGCLSVKVDGVPVEDFDGKTLTVKLGQKVTLVGNTDLYNFNYSIYIDGVSQYFYGSYEFTVTKTEYAINVNATKYTSYSAYLTIDTPENISVYPGNSNTAMEIQAGVATAIELTSNSNYINLMPSTDCYISSILVNGVEYGSNYGTSSVTVRNINENDQIIVVTGKIARDKSATMWVDDLNAAQYGYGVQRYSDRASVTLVSGEAVTVNFDDSDNPYYLSFYSPKYCSIFNNGVYNTPQYEGSTTYYITLVDGDEIKIYLASEPEKYTVTVTQNASDAITGFTTDGQAYSNYASGFTALKDTQVGITLDSTSGAQVVVDGEAASVDENGVYNVAITKDTEIVIDNTNSIESIAGNEATDNNVYNLQGILVIKNASAEQINALPAGLYIVNGKKVVVRN